VLRTIGDARAYMLALPKEREWLDHGKPAYRLLGSRSRCGGVDPAALPEKARLFAPEKN
jgi:hypothetical protein